MDRASGKKTNKQQQNHLQINKWEQKREYLRKDLEPWRRRLSIMNKEIMLHIAVLTRKTCLWQRKHMISIMPGKNKVCFFLFFSLLFFLSGGQGGAKGLSYGQLVRSRCVAFQVSPDPCDTDYYFSKA